MKEEGRAVDGDKCGGQHIHNGDRQRQGWMWRLMKGGDQ